MNWKEINSEKELEAAIELSFQVPVLIFKHSTRCGISSMALDRLYRNHDELREEKVEIYILDVIANRSLSQQVQDKFNVWHESPQAILLRNGEVKYHDSHMGIYIEPIKKAIRN